MPGVMNVVGARPQFVKAGPVSRALAASGLVEILVHTGQHYDRLMSDAIMADVGLRDPDYNLGVGSGSHGVQTGLMLQAIESLILDTGPDVVLTYGDTNSTIAAALAAAKLHVPTAHVEAGLRSFNRAMPEELNRVATDHLSDLLFAPTDLAMSNLSKEGLEERAILTGDVMVDALHAIDLESLELPDWSGAPFYAATIHRPSNTDDPERIAGIIEALGTLDAPVHLMAHPRLKGQLEGFNIELPDSVIVDAPLPYATMLGVVKASQGLITDSGGLQKEAFILGVPCTTVRDETEWPETLEGGWNVLAGSDLAKLAELVVRKTESDRANPFGSGNAASEIVAQLMKHID
ncbi:MAG TPA: UDP-N-acetylglucosamine 2-epimerase (non-hydrolyzing) [Acidimicrobiia bacterium]